MSDELNVTLEDESPVIEVQIISTGPVWISTIDNNTWAPGVYGWDPI